MIMKPKYCSQQTGVHPQKSHPLFFRGVRCVLLLIRRLLRSKARQQCHNLKSCCVNLEEGPKTFCGKIHKTLSHILDGLNVLLNQENKECNWEMMSQLLSKHNSKLISINENINVTFLNTEQVKAAQKMSINSTYCKSFMNLSPFFFHLFFFLLGAEQEEDPERDGARHADPTR